MTTGGFKHNNGMTDGRRWLGWISDLLLTGQVIVRECCPSLPPQLQAFLINT
jgi:hypothetical protein